MLVPRNAVSTVPPRSALCLAVICGLLLLCPHIVHGQVSTLLGPASPVEAESGQAVTLTVPILQAEKVERMYLLYRPFGSSDYDRLDMEVTGNVASASLPARIVTPPFVEYYMVILTRTGALVTHPVSESQDPFTFPPANTLRLAVKPAEAPTIPVIFLSPEPDRAVAPEDVLISFSLFRVDSTIARKATRLLLDGADVTGKAVISGDIVVYVPEEISAGNHRVTVELFTNDTTMAGTASLSFTVAPPLRYTAGQPEQARAVAFRYNASVQLESRHEDVREIGTWYNRGTIRFTGSLDSWRVHSNLFITSDEEDDRQPQNRYFVGIESRWLKVGYGDSYPSFPDLILSGKRVRGLNSSLKLDFFNVDVAIGKTVRAIEGHLFKTFPADSFSVEFARDSTAPYDRVSPTLMGKFGYGTYARDLFIVRPSFGSGKTWQLGLTYMKSKDDAGSIRYGFRPQENLVVGADFVARLDSRHIELSGQAAFSAFNSDISSGNFTDAYIDSVFNEGDRNTVREVRDILGSYITVNDNLRPLSLKKPSTLSYDLTLNLHYLDQVLRASYVFRGSDYHSFGQTFLRKDVRGFNLQDRIRLFENAVSATLGYERLEDNTSGTKVATTTYATYTAALTYRGNADIPAISFGFNRFANTNGLSPEGPRAANVVDDATNRFYLQSSYDFTFGMRHTAMLDISTSTRDDRSLRRADVRNTAIGLSVSTRYALPLYTTVSILTNFNTLPPLTAGGGPRSLDYTMLSLYGRYEIVPETVYITGTLSPTLGEFRRLVSDVGAEWRMYPSMTLSGEISYFQNQGAPNDNFVSVRYRYDL